MESTSFFVCFTLPSLRLYTNIHTHAHRRSYQDKKKETQLLTVWTRTEDLCFEDRAHCIENLSFLVFVFMKQVQLK